MALRRIGRVLILFILLFPKSFYSQVDHTIFSTPSDLGNLDNLSLWATEYYVHITQSEGTIPYLTPNGDTLGYFSDTCDFCTACLEGTVFIEDSSGDRIVLNFASKAETALVNCRECSLFTNSTLNVESWGSVRWQISSGYGEGVKGYRLVPYRTVAVDPKIIPYGTVLYIPDAKGTVINDSGNSTFVHDGFFFAGDTGGAIKGNHIDVFTGKDNSHPFDFVKSKSSNVFSAYIIQDDHIITALTLQHSSH